MHTGYLWLILKLSCTNNLIGNKPSCNHCAVWVVKIIIQTMSLMLCGRPLCYLKWLFAFTSMSVGDFTFLQQIKSGLLEYLSDY